MTKPVILFSDKHRNLTQATLFKGLLELLVDKLGYEVTGVELPNLENSRDYLALYGLDRNKTEVVAIDTNADARALTGASFSAIASGANIKNKSSAMAAMTEASRQYTASMNTRNNDMASKIQSIYRQGKSLVVLSGEAHMYGLARRLLRASIPFVIVFPVLQSVIHKFNGASIRVSETSGLNLLDSYRNTKHICETMAPMVKNIALMTVNVIPLQLALLKQSDTFTDYKKILKEHRQSLFRHIVTTYGPLHIILLDVFKPKFMKKYLESWQHSSSNSPSTTNSSDENRKSAPSSKEQEILIFNKKIPESNLGFFNKKIQSAINNGVIQKGMLKLSPFDRDGYKLSLIRP